MALIHANFYSETLGMERSMDVILPQSQNGIGQTGQQEQGKTPVLYLLHGASDDHTIWQRRTSIERYAVAKGLAVVIPCTDLGFYCDMKYGYDFYQFFSKELPKLVHEFFPMISQERKDTFIAGLSMGGFGAFKLAINCPEQYSYAASLSGYLDPVMGMQEMGEGFLQDVMGSTEETARSINDLPWRLRQQLEAETELPQLFMCCGTEDFLYKMNRHFYETFKDQLQLTYWEEPGTHEWGFWDRNIQRVLDWLPLDQKGGI